MKVVLLSDVKDVGRKFEVKDVSSGYATNFLIPKGLAVAGTKTAIKRAELEKARHVAEKKIQEDLLVKNIGDLKGITVKITVEKSQANDKGHLFASIHNDRIIAGIKEQTRLDVLPEFVHTEKPIKAVGDHAISVKAGGKEVEFTLSVEVA